MAWEASIIEVLQDPTEGVAKVTYSFSDGKEIIEKTERVSDVARIKELARLHLNNLEQKTVLKEEISKPTLGKVSFENSVPSQEELELADFQKKLLNYRQTKKAFDMGLETQQTLDASYLLLKTAYKTKYVNLL